MRHGSDEFKKFLLTRVASLFCKCVVRISSEASRKIAARSGLIRAGHCDFIAVVKLRYAASGQYKHTCQLQTIDRRPFFAHEATVVVTASEAGSQRAIFPLLGMLVCFTVRLVALHRDVNLPSLHAGKRDD